MKRFICGVVLALALGARAQSSIEAMTNFVGTTSGTFSPIYTSINGTQGWTFLPLVDVSVTSLGVWNYLLPGHSSLLVGLWNASGALLASNTITAANPLVNQSRYGTISPVTLTAGQTYYLGAFSPGPLLQSIAVAPNDPDGPNGYASMSPFIELGTLAYMTNGQFSFPSLTENLPGSAIVAPNFEFQPVPEPSLALILPAGIGLLGLMARRIRA